MTSTTAFRDRYDVVIIGGGFFGLYLGRHIRLKGYSVAVCEKADDFMLRASYVNQARIHNGYHYPRSFLTASRSRINFPRFVADFEPCIEGSFEKYYAVARKFSKVSSRQFLRFVHNIKAPIAAAPKRVKRLFDDGLIEDVYTTREPAFNTVILRELILERCRHAEVELFTATEVTQISPAGEECDVTVVQGTQQQQIRARHVFNCTYSQLNQVLAKSNHATIPLKHELTEMALIEPPEPLRDKGITVMCGPFFSCMPFPALGYHSFSHVRYTPHFHWFDRPRNERPQKLIDGDRLLAKGVPQSTYAWMVRDAARYLPSLSESRYRGSIWEVKTVLPRNEVDDGRPILFKKNFGCTGFHHVLGGKIDNVYDVAAEIDRMM